MTVQPCCSGASSRERPRRLAPPGGSLQAGLGPDFSPSTHMDLIKTGFIVSRCGSEVKHFFCTGGGRIVKFALKQSASPCKRRPICCTIIVERAELRACAQKLKNLKESEGGCYG